MLLELVSWDELRDLEVEHRRWQHHRTQAGGIRVKLDWGRGMKEIALSK